MSRPDFRDLFQIYTRAAALKDVDLMMSIYDDQAVIFDAWDAWSSSGREDWRAAIEGWFRSDSDGRILVEFTGVRVEGDGELRSSWATVGFAIVADNGKVLRSLQNRLTWVARSVGGQWRILHQHTSVPIATADFKGVLRPVP